MKRPMLLLTTALYQLRNYELHAVVGIYDNLRRYSRSFFWQTSARRDCNSLGL